MKVKNKLWLGFGFLFVVVLLFGAVCLYYINQVADSSKVILKDNYISLNYCREMRGILDNNEFKFTGAAVEQFGDQLKKEETNITEPGEADAVAKLRSAYSNLQINLNNPAFVQATIHQMRGYIMAIEGINMRAITRKNNNVQQSVDHSLFVLGFVASITILVLFSFTINFPNIIVKPINTLLAGIRSISEKDYKTRINFTKDDEFAEVAAAFNNMAGQLNEWENSNLSKLRSEKLRIETIIEQMQDAIIGVNEQQQILFINSTAKQVFNLGRVEGKLVDGVVKDSATFKALIDKGKPGQAFNITINGKTTHFELETREIAVPNIGDDYLNDINVTKKQAGKVFILKNVTGFKERDEAKTNFIATISHELKTPIAAIKMSLKLLNDERIGKINTDQQQLLGNIENDSDRLLKITGELLDLARVETGNLQLNFIAVNPIQIVDYAVSAVSFPAQQKNITLRTEADNYLPTVNADVEKTAWVLINFLSNALRYSEEGSTVIIAVTNKTNAIEFAVTDTGKGIDEQYQQRLFDRYFQVPADGYNKTGTGLGLTISKDFIEAQNGEIGVNSELGKGSTFYFRLPIA